MYVVHAAVQVFLESIYGRVGEKHDSKLSALAADGDLPRLEVDVFPVEGPKLREAKAGGKEEVQDGCVSLAFFGHSIRSREKPMKFFRVQNLDFPLLLFETLYSVWRVCVEFFFLDQVPEESSEDRQMVVLRPDRELLAPARPEIMELLLIRSYTLLAEIRDGFDGGQTF